MTIATLIRHLQEFLPTSDVLVRVPSLEDGKWAGAPVGVVYWDADARKVIIEGS